MNAIAIDRLHLSTHRAVNEAKVAELAKSIQDLDGQLLHPIVIDENNNVLAGAHRVAAFRLIGHTHIPATVVTLKGIQAELAQLDENLVRNDGTALEQANALRRRKEIYETLHPEVKHGGDRRSEAAKSKPNNSDLKSFSKDAAEKTKKSEDSIQNYVRVAEQLSPEVQEIIEHTPAAEKITELMDLAKLPPKEQVKIAKQVAATGQAVRKLVKADEGDEINSRFTPRALIEQFHAEFGFSVDVASDPKSPAAQIIKKFWTKRHDGLSKEWRGERVWCNPPFDNIPAWVRKAHDEVRFGGCPLVVMLMPSVRTEQPFWQEDIEPYRDRAPIHRAKVTTRFLAGRPRFGYPNDPEGEKSGSPEFGCVLVIWEAVESAEDHAAPKNKVAGDHLLPFERVPLIRPRADAKAERSKKPYQVKYRARCVPHPDGLGLKWGPWGYFEKDRFATLAEGEKARLKLIKTKPAGEHELDVGIFKDGKRIDDYGPQTPHQRAASRRKS